MESSRNRLSHGPRGSLALAPGPRGTWFADAALAVLATLVGLAGTYAIRHWYVAYGERVPERWAYALVLAAGLVLVARRRWPVATATVSTLATSTYLVLNYPYGPILFSFAIAIYSVARYLTVHTAAIVSGAALLTVLAHLVAGLLTRGPTNSPGLIGVVPASAWVVVPFAAGVAVRLARETADRNRAEAIRRYADEQRLRVAREVHDVVGHGLAAINMQAEIALHLLAKRPEQAQTALTAISRTSREALDELRATLTVLRLGDLGEVRAPTPGLARLDTLVARMSDTGVAVRVDVTGVTRRLPDAVDLAAYRIVQESLTNVLRHAGTTAAAVSIDYRPGVLTLEVTDDGRGSADGAPSGHGIDGMRERLVSLGGTFEASSGPGGGFRVRATLPLDDTDAADGADGADSADAAARAAGADARGAGGAGGAGGPGGAAGAGGAQPS